MTIHAQTHTYKHVRLWVRTWTCWHNKLYMVKNNNNNKIDKIEREMI